MMTEDATSGENNATGATSPDELDSSIFDGVDAIELFLENKRFTASIAIYILCSDDGSMTKGS